jgi:hypothetical protein
MAGDEVDEESLNLRCDDVQAIHELGKSDVTALRFSCCYFVS